MRYLTGSLGLVMPVDPRIGIALQAMQVRFYEPLTICVLARAVGLSISRFEHLFTKQIGCSFGNRLQEIRLENSARLLPDYTLSVKEVCGKVGYSHAPSFSRAFKRRFGLTPTEFRRKSIGEVNASEIHLELRRKSKSPQLESQGLRHFR
jgi:transcriptional regulator GlxA family with amidase domain